MIQAGNTEGISDIIRFVLEIDKLKGVLRKVKPTGEDRYENTAEHSWQIALFALSLAQVVEISVDVNRVIAMLLVHDLGEIDAGDKFVFAQDGWEDRKVAELRAVERICDIAPLKSGRLADHVMERVRCGRNSGSPFRKSHRPMHAGPAEPEPIKAEAGWRTV